MIRQDSEKTKQYMFAVKSLLVLSRFCNIENFTNKNLISSNELTMKMTEVWDTPNWNFLPEIERIYVSTASRAFGSELEISTLARNCKISLDNYFGFFERLCTDVTVEFMQKLPITAGMPEHIIRLTFKKINGAGIPIREQLWDGFSVLSLTGPLSTDLSHRNSITIVRAWMCFHSQVIQERRKDGKN